jgi:hypothetical protein
MKEKLPKKPSWKELQAHIVRANGDYVRSTYTLREYIYQWPERLHCVVALALSVAHWSREAREGYGDDGNKGVKSEFPTGIDVCGLCCLYALKGGCSPCPLDVAGQSCFKGQNLYRKVHCAIYQDGRGFHAAADALYNKLVELYLAELRRLGYDA